MGSLDPAKILIILVVALVVLGPERLPRVARQLGAAWRELTRVRDQVTDELRSALPDDLPSIPRMPTNLVSGFIADLTRPAVSDVGADAPGTDAVHSEVEAADELVSSSSSGWNEESAMPGQLAGPAASGGVGAPAEHGWSMRSSQAGSWSARSIHEAAPPVVSTDDPSMN